MVLQREGYRGTGSDMARSFASYGQRVSGPQVGAIAVMGRRGGGHVGIISGIDAQGNPIMISGNNGNRVREAPVSRGRIYAYVVPTNWGIVLTTSLRSVPTTSTQDICSKGKVGTAKWPLPALQ